MKKLPEIIAILGVIFLITAVFARFFGENYRLLGIKTASFIALANTSFLLAILAKLFEKK